MKRLLAGFVLGMVFTLYITGSGFELILKAKEYSNERFSSLTQFIGKERTDQDAKRVSAELPSFDQQYDDNTLYRISLGDPVTKVVEILGEPKRVDPSHIGVEWLIYNQDLENYIQIGIMEEKVVTIFTNGSKWKLGGVQMGQTLSEVEPFLGQPEHKVSITSSVSIQGNGTGERVVYKYNGMIVLLYLDKYDGMKVAGIRLFTPELFAQTALKLGFKVLYYNKEDVTLPSLATEKRQEVEQAYERQIADLTNVIRLRSGLNILKYNEQVAEIAKGHSLDMFLHHFFDHTSPNSGELKDRFSRSPLKHGSFGENIAAGYLDGIDSVAGWMNSSGHRENILNTYADQIGVGVIIGKNGDYDFYYTQNFYGN